MRLFFAVEIPAPMQAKVERLQSLLRRSQADIRWVRTESAHLTLLFLGDVDDNEIVAIDEVARHCAVAARPMGLRLAGVGTFPEKGSPRTVWLGVGGDIGPLVALQGSLQHAMCEVGFAAERRPYHPHLTLGRVRGRRQLEGLRHDIDAHHAVDLGRFTATRFVLYESRLSRAGARYAIAATYELAV